MPMTSQSNAAQEQVYDTAVGFHAVKIDNTWTMSASVHVEGGDDYIETVEGHSDYNEALVELKSLLDSH